MAGVQAEQVSQAGGEASRSCRKEWYKIVAVSLQKCRRRCADKCAGCRVAYGSKVESHMAESPSMENVPDIYPYMVARKRGIWRYPIENSRGRKVRQAGIMQRGVGE